MSTLHCARYAVALTALCFSFPAYADAWSDALAAFNNADRYEEAARLLTPLAEAADARAQMKLADLYMFGEGVPLDTARAFGLAMSAAQHGNAEGEQWVAAQLFSGLGVPKDEAEGFRWLLRAAAHGNPVSLLSLATLYGEGIYVTKDVERGLGYLRQSVKLGEYRAQFVLARTLYSGELGLERDLQRAVSLLSLASNQLYAPAQILIAALLFDPANPRRSPLESLTWAFIVRAYGSCKRAEQLIELIVPGLSLLDIEVARRASDAFVADHPVLDRHRHDEGTRAFWCSGLLLGAPPQTSS